MKSWIIVGASCLWLLATVWGQEPQFRQQEQLQPSPLPPFQVEEKLTLAPRNQELGMQQLLLRVPPPPWLELSSGTDLLYVDNAFLTQSDRESDRLFAETLQATITPPLPIKQLKLALVGDHQWFRYCEHSVLDFDANHLGFLLTWQIGKSFSLAGGYSGLWLKSRPEDRQFYREGDARLALSWWRPLTDRLAVSAGVSFDHHNTTPSAYDRADYALFLAGRCNLTRHLAAELYYRYQYEDFDNSRREDSSHLVGGSLVYSLCRYASLRAVVSQYWNDSNTTDRDYRVLNAGGNLQLAVRF